MVIYVILKRCFIFKNRHGFRVGEMDIYILVLSSENCYQNAELFLPRKLFLSGYSAVDSDGTSDIIGFPMLSVFS